MLPFLKNLKHRLIRSLWESDPGYVHLRQGTRTLLAALITLIALPWPGLGTQLLAAFAAGLACQGINGARRRDQKMTFVISSVLLLGYFLIINYAQPSHLATGIAFTAASFLVFASRSLGPRYALFPLFTWIMGFITSLFPSVAGNALLERFGCITLGCVISFIVYFYIVPPRHLSYFFRNMRYFIALVSATLLELQQQLTKPNPFYARTQHHWQLRRSLRKYYLHNQNILTSFQILDSSHEEHLLSILSDHYLAGKALLMLQDSLIALTDTHLMQTLDLKDDLCQALKDIRLLTHLLYIDLKDLRIKLTKSATPFHSFSILRDKLDDAKETATTLVPLYHFIISLNELYDNLLALTQHDKLPCEVSHAQ